MIPTSYFHFNLYVHVGYTEEYNGRCSYACMGKDDLFMQLNYPMFEGFNYNMIYDV